MLEKQIQDLIDGKDVSIDKIDPHELVLYLASQQQVNVDYQQAVMTMASAMTITLANVLIHTGNIKDVDKFSDLFIKSLDETWNDLIEGENEDEQTQENQ